MDDGEFSKNNAFTAAVHFLTPPPNTPSPLCSLKRIDPIRNQASEGIICGPRSLSNGVVVKGSLYFLVDSCLDDVGICGMSSSNHVRVRIAHDCPLIVGSTGRLSNDHPFWVIIGGQPS